MPESDAEIRIDEEPIERLALLADIPIAFTVDRVLEVVLHDDGLGGIALDEAPLGQPWIKDYDAIDGEGPTHWATRFDVTNWGLLTARRGDNLLGGAVVAFDTPQVNMLEGRLDLAVLWDLRVQRQERSKGIGSLLFRAVESWALQRGCGWLKVETQNINVPACRFYERMGCTLRAIDRFAYADPPTEAQLIWWKALRLVSSPAIDSRT